MKPDFEKIAQELYEKARFFQEYYALQDIEHELSGAYLEGRKAQVKIDAEIAINYPNYFKTTLKAMGGRISDANPSIKTSQKIAKAIESQELL